jgi:hypothetical protein
MYDRHTVHIQHIGRVYMRSPRPVHTLKYHRYFSNILRILLQSRFSYTFAVSAQLNNNDNFYCYKDPIYLQSVIIHSANGGKGEGCLVEEYSVALLC